MRRELRFESHYHVGGYVGIHLDKAVQDGRCRKPCIRRLIVGELPERVDQIGRELPEAVPLSKKAPQARSGKDGDASSRATLDINSWFGSDCCS